MNLGFITARCNQAENLQYISLQYNNNMIQLPRSGVLLTEASGTACGLERAHGRGYLCLLTSPEPLRYICLTTLLRLVGSHDTLCLVLGRPYISTIIHAIRSDPRQLQSQLKLLQNRRAMQSYAYPTEYRFGVGLYLLEMS